MKKKPRNNLPVEIGTHSKQHIQASNTTDIKSLDTWITKNYIVLLIFLLLFSFFVRIWRIEIPSSYYFDEVYHALTAKLIARNDVRAYEWWHSPVEPNTAIEWTHPPLAKLFQATGIVMFGENSFGWRISSVIFGVLCIYMVANVAETLFRSKSIAFLSTFLFALDGLVITQSRLAMNDIHLLFFLLLTIKMYLMFKSSPAWSRTWKKYLLLTGVCIGLTIASKWSGILVIGIIAVDQFFSFIRDKHLSGKILAACIFSWIFLPIVVYVATYGQMFLQGKGYAHFKELTSQMYWYHSGLVATHPYQSTPLQWVLNLRPVWLYVDYSHPNMIANMYAQGNTALYWVGFSTVIFFLVFSFSHHNSVTLTEKQTSQIFRIELQHFPKELLFLIPSYLVLWVPYLLSPRIMFFYHYLLAVPFLCMILGYGLYQLLKYEDWRKIFAYVIIISIVLNFVIFLPNWTGLFVPTTFRDSVYGFIPSWK